MSADVVDLTARRAAKAAQAARPVLRFPTMDAAFKHATRNLRHIEDLTSRQLLVAASDIETPLAEVGAVIDAWRRRHAGRHPDHQGTK